MEIDNKLTWQTRSLQKFQSNHVYTICDWCHNNLEIISDMDSVYTATLVCVLIFISNSNHDATISKVIHYMGQSIQEWTK